MRAARGAPRPVAGNRPLGVGVIGAGEAARAIHLPVLARMPALYRMAAVTDIRPRAAARVAAATGARPHSTVGALLDDPEVDVVLVCSPHEAHSAHIIAACEAGKRAVLCEKPLAGTLAQAREISAAVTASGVPLLLGTMHRWDPAVLGSWAGDITGFAGAPVVRSAILLPPNDVFVGAAADSAGPARGSAPARPSAREMILGLATHDIPLIRAIMPSPGTVRFARTLSPWGYQIITATGAQHLHMTALMLGEWPPRWTLRASRPAGDMLITFPPSYVLTGSAAVSFSSGGSTRTLTSPLSGYEAQWLHLAEVATGQAAPRVRVAELVADLAYALDIADQAQAFPDAGTGPA